MNLDQVEYKFCGGDGDFDVEAWIDGARIGYMWCMREGQRVNLLDIHVEEEFSISSPHFGASPRGIGIGYAMMRRFLLEADAAGINEIYGDIMPKDFTPRLAAWYKRQGFDIVDPDETCDKSAIRKIIRRFGNRLTDAI